MPWLVGTALIHSLAVTEKRGAFKSWTVLLAIVAFSLSLLGTFLVRSGVLTSVHAFATDPRRGIFILGFLAIVVGGSLARLRLARAARGPRRAVRRRVARIAAAREQRAARRAPWRRCCSARSTRWCSTRWGSGKISVGPPYFDTVFVPIMAPAVFLMAIGPMASWKKAALPDLATRLKWALVVAVACAIIVPFARGKWSTLVALGLFLAFWVVFATLVAVRLAPQGRPAADAPRRSCAPIPPPGTACSSPTSAWPPSSSG